MIYDLRFTIYALCLLAASAGASAQVVGVKPPDLNRDSTVLTNGMVITTNTGVLKSVVAVNHSASDLWLLVFDLSTNALPANGRLPVMSVPIPAGKAGFWDPPAGRNFRNGIIVANSTTSPALTNSTANFWIAVSYDGKKN